MTGRARVPGQVLAEAGGEPFGDGSAVGGLVVYAEVDGFRVGEKEEVAEGAGAVVAVNAVGVLGRGVLRGWGTQGAFDHAGPAGPVDAAEPQHRRPKRSPENQLLPFEEALSGGVGGFRRRDLVYPFPVLLAVDPGAGDEDEAPDVLLFPRAEIKFRGPST